MLWKFGRDEDLKSVKTCPPVEEVNQPSAIEPNDFWISATSTVGRQESAFG
jgi:hypothetical protein